MTNSEPPITVITVTRRAEHLVRCLRSVREQDYRGRIRHLILADGNEDCVAVARAEGVPESDTHCLTRGPGDVDGPVRLAGLRNLGAKLAGQAWSAFIDDDNRWASNHLRTLWSTVAETGADLAHSQRLLFEADGQAYARDEFPWGRDPATRKAVHAYCLAAGIMSPGSNIMRDELRMRFTWVDLGEWLFPPGFLLANPFSTRYDAWDWYDISVEDRDLPRAVQRSGMTVASTGEPTLHYFMGGYTNSTEGASVYWREPSAVELTQSPA